MNTEFTEFVRDSMEQFAADIRLPAGLADRARRRNRQRWFGQCAALVAGTAALSVIVATVVTGRAGRTAPESTTGAGPTGHVLTTAYVVQRVSNALANDNLVMRDTIPATEDGRPLYIEGRQELQWVGWSYQGNATQTMEGVNSQPLYEQGSAYVGGKLVSATVDYIAHEWTVLPGGNYVSSLPQSSECSRRNDVSPSAFGINWPSLIQSALACGAYRAEGYVNIGGAEAIKVTGSYTMNFPENPRSLLNGFKRATILFVNPKTFLPIQSLEFAARSGHSLRLVQTVSFQWLKPTPANIAETLLTIPAGYLDTPRAGD
jgi:hypothetical protein